MLTKKQLKQIEKIIKSRFLMLRWEMFGERDLTEEEVKVLKDAKLLRGRVRDFTGDAYILGKIASRMGPEGAKGLSYSEVLDRAKDLPSPTQVEMASIEWAAIHAGQYITKLSDDMVREVTTAASRTTSSALRAVQDNVTDAIRNRKTISELATSLRTAIDSRDTDWDRIAFTEMNNSIQNGLADGIRKGSSKGGDQLVFKRPSSDACKWCKKLYLKSDQVTPVVFKIKDLAESNMGLKAKDWKPTIGAVHPWCQCQLHEIPDGYNFVKDESDDVVRLQYTGETAQETASVAKSFHKSETEHDHDEEASCSCCY